MDVDQAFEESQKRGGMCAGFVNRVWERRREAGEKAVRREIAAKRQLELRQAKRFMHRHNMPEWVREIVFDECGSRRISPIAVLGHRRFPELVRARWAIWYRVKATKPKLSFLLMGQWFGGRDHTTIIHAVAAHARAHDLPSFTKYDLDEARARYVRFHQRAAMAVAA